MEKKITISIPSVFLKVLLFVVLLLLGLKIFEQISVTRTLSGDGKIHHVMVKPFNDK